VWPAGAHHSLAEFDNSKTVAIAGVVKEFRWINPHSSVLIDVMNDQGASDTWTIQGQAPKFLEWRGWTKDTLKPGDKVSMTIYRLKNGQKGGTCLRVKLADDREMLMLENPSTSPEPPATSH